MQRSTKCAGVIIICLTVLGFALPAAAQAVPKAELSGGYQFLMAKSKGDPDYEKFKKGWYADVAGNVNKMIAVVFSAGGNYKKITEGGGSFDLKVHEFMGGVRVSGRKNPMVVPFGQVLVGGTRLKGSQGTESRTETDLTTAVGGGVNVMPKGKVGLRIGGDYVHVKAKTGSNTLLDGDSLNGFRFVVGINVPFGMR